MTPASGRSAFFFIMGLWIVLGSCAVPDKKIDQVAVGPGKPPDSLVTMGSEEVEKVPAKIKDKIAEGPIKITVQEAILLALENNRSLAVERLNPSIQKTFEDQERALFDPETNAEISVGRSNQQRLTRTVSGTESSATNILNGTIALSEYFPTGTTLEIEGTTQVTDSSLYKDSFYSNRLGMTITQALLKGYGTDVNLARLRQARLDTLFSEYELRGFSEALVAQVESTCWDYILAQRQIEIFEESLKLARQQSDETDEMIRVGKMAEAEMPAVQAEVAAQEQGLINARSNMEITRLKLLRLLNPMGDNLWNREVFLIHEPTLPDIKLDNVEAHIAVSMRMRPELNQARLDMLSEDLELVRTKNGLLPLMDLFITLGKTGYADSFGGSISDFDGSSYDIFLGAKFQYPIFNRDAKARYQRSLVSREQSQKAMENLSQLVEVDVRSAYIEVNRTKQQIAATSAKRKFDEEKLRIETEKFRVGTSTNFLVAQAQRDLLVSRIDEVQAIANYLKALIDLYHLDGSLLERRGIISPGREPVKLPTQG